MNVLDVNQLAGVWDFERYRWARENASPQEHLGHTYLTFEVDDALYERVLSESRLLGPSGAAERLCPDEGATIAPGGRLAFEVGGPADAKRAWVICVATTRGSDV